MARARFLVQGRVQGVGFRAWAVREANLLAVTGWVRNRADGSVELDASGSPDALERLAVRLAEGPPHAQVSRVAREDHAGGGDAGARGFRILT